MASAQAVENAKSYYEKNKEVVDAMKKETESIVVNPRDGDKMFATACVGINNQTGWTLNLSSNKNWFGRALTIIPQQIEFPAVRGFVHGAKIDEFNSVDMGAIVYAMGDSAYGCLVAWSVNKQSPLQVFPPIYYNQVYVETGKIEELIKWDDIKAKLNKSENTSYSYDKQTETLMVADITPTGNQAKLTAICSKIKA